MSQARPRAGAASPPRPTPDWVRDAVFYEVQVRAFFDSDGDGAGDLAGLTARLDVLCDLGVDALWLLPFFPSPLRDDGYDVADHCAVHPRYGTLDDFRRLVDAAHARGMKVVTELVVNHTSDTHPWFAAARQAPPGAPERDFYVWSDDPHRFSDTPIIFTGSETSNWTRDPVAGAWYCHRFFAHQPDLNLNNPAVVDAVLGIMRFWLDLGVDGFRLDAAPYFCVREGTSNQSLPETHAVIRRMRALADSYQPPRVLMVEANLPQAELNGYFDAGRGTHLALDFPLLPRLFQALARQDAGPLHAHLATRTAPPGDGQWVTFARNHDELTLALLDPAEREELWCHYAPEAHSRVYLGIRRRLAPLLGNQPDRIALMFFLLLTLPGTPIIYYGDEIGMGDAPDLPDRHGLRTPLQWDASAGAGFSVNPDAAPWPPVITSPEYGPARVNLAAQRADAHSLWHRLRRLIALRRAAPALRAPTLCLLDTGTPAVLGYLRVAADGTTLLCLANLAATPRQGRIALPGGARPRLIPLGPESAPPPAADGSLLLPGHAGQVYRLAP